jgi:hypothetical protein
VRLSHWIAGAGSRYHRPRGVGYGIESPRLVWLVASVVEQKKTMRLRIGPEAAGHETLSSRCGGGSSVESVAHSNRRSRRSNVLIDGFLFN